MWTSVVSSAEGGAPCARGKHAAAALGGDVYVLGGRGAGARPLRDVWRYSLDNGGWERVAAGGDTPPALQEHTATAHAGRLYVFGGEPAAMLDETPLWVLDVASRRWRKLSAGAGRGPRGPAAAPRGRRGHSAHALNDCLLIYGGYKDLRGSTEELWAFHYETETWAAVRTATRGPARHRHAAALHDARLYVHGGTWDLHDQADLWHYDTISRVWTCVRTPPRVSPAARSGHAGLRAGAHFYIFGGEVAGQPTNELWRFHFATETWERMEQGMQWPSPRVDCRVLLVRGAAGDEVAISAGVMGAGATGEPGAGPGGGGRGEGLLRELARLSTIGRRRGAYAALGARDSTESLALNKSRSAHALAASRGLARDPVSVPDLAGVTRLDSEEDEEEEDSLATSDYSSAERVHRLAALGFSNPHYLGPDVRRLGRLGLALTPDSGLGVELREVRRTVGGGGAGGPEGRTLLALVVGGREAAHVARLAAPLSMWTYRLL